MIGVGSLNTYCTAEVLGTHVFVVAIPFEKSLYSKNQIGQEMQAYRNVELFETDDTIMAATGHYLREREARALLTVLKPRYPAAYIARLTDFSPPGSPLPWRSRIKLSDIGYQRDVISYGPSPYITVSFPWSPDASIQGGRLSLHLKWPATLKVPSSVHVTVSGISAGTYELASGQGEMVLSIPMAPLARLLYENPPGGRLNVTVQGSLRLFNDYCKDLRASELWMAMGSDSCLELSRTSDPALLNRFLLGSSPSIVVAADQAKLDICQGALTMVAAAKAAVPSVNVTCGLAPAVNPFGHTVVVGDFDRDLVIAGNTLYVTPDGTRALADKASQLLATTKATVQDVKDTEWNIATTPLAFSFLGFKTTSVKGVRELITQLNFTLPQINGLPKTLTAVLHVAHTPIPQEDKGLLKIRLNGNLVGSQRLSRHEKSMPFTTSFTLPVDKLTDRNRLEVVFAYYISQSFCDGLPAEMEATLFEDSSLLTGPQDTNSTHPLRLDRIMGSMDGRGALVVPGLSESDMHPLAKWAAMYGALHRQTPNFILTDTIPDRMHFDYLVMSVGASPVPEGVNALVTTGKEIFVRNPLTNEVPFKVSADEPVWIIQTFRHKDAPALVFSCLAPGKTPIPDLELKEMERLGGNVAAGRGRHWQSMDIGRKLVAKAPEKPDFTYYWDQYRLAATLALAAVLVCFFYYMYARLTGKKN